MPKRVSLKGKGADLFFGDYPAIPAADSTSTPAPTEVPKPRESPSGGQPTQHPMATSPQQPVDEPAAAPSQRKPARSRRVADNSESVLDRTHASRSDSVLASTLSLADAATVEAIRQVIKSPGREVSFVRLTPEEKAHLGDIVYTFKRQGQKTSETEINRIAINYLLLDFHEHGEQSVLAQVLAALRS